MLCFPIEVAAMKTAVSLAAASAMLVSSLLVPAAFAQSSGANNVPPPPGIHDPGVKAVAPPDLKPRTLPAPSERSVAADRDPSLPDVRVRQQGDNSVQEYSRNGRVYMVVVTPKNGIPQTYMVDPEGRLVDEHGQKPTRPVMYKVLEWGKSKPATDDSSEATPADDGH
jgi:hypothetical protein